MENGPEKEIGCRSIAWVCAGHSEGMAHRHEAFGVGIWVGCGESGFHSVSVCGSDGNGGD